MRLPELPYTPPAINWRVIVWTLVATVVMAGIVFSAPPQPRYGYRPPNNQSIALAVRDLEIKVRKLEARIRRLERGR